MAIVTLKKSGHTNSYIIDYILANFDQKVSERLIRRTMSRYNETGSVEDRKRAGRPIKCDQRALRIVRRIALADRTLSLRKVAATASIRLGFSLTANTIRTVLSKFGLHCRVAARIPFLTKNQRKKTIRLGIGSHPLATSSVGPNSIYR